MSDIFSKNYGVIKKSRIISFGFFVIIVSALYVIQLFNLQVVDELFYKNRAKAISMRTFPLPAQRGKIFDRNENVPLVSNRDSFAVNVTLGLLSESQRESVFEKLAKSLDISKESIYEIINKHRSQFYQAIEIKSGVSFSEIVKIAEHSDKYPGVTWNSKPMRNYNELDSMSHILGYVGNITVEELQVLYNEGYHQNSVIGKMGIEKQYDSLLRGKDGIAYSTVDVKGRQVGDLENRIEIPKNGKDLVLTVDRKIQKLSEKALGSRMGSVIVMQPSTGDILAMVSYPWYDPNIFYTNNAEEQFNRLSIDKNNPFLNRAIQSAHPPGSTFKIVMTTASLAENAFNPEATIDCKGSFRLGDRVFSCHVLQGHGPLNLKDALAESCNVYFYTLGIRHLGIEAIVEYSNMFGFGAISGVDIPGEISGLVPTPEWKQKQFGTSWVGGDTVNLSIGQGNLLLTPIQMANMIAMTVNKGTIYKPHFLKKVKDPVSGKIEMNVEPEIAKTAPIERDVFDEVQANMRGVITDGTAKPVITTKVVDIAGKTGTAEVGYEDRWHAWFAASGPYGAAPEEQLVVVTMVEASNEWEWWAIRAANIIFQGIFANQTYDEAIEALRWGWLHNDRREETQ